MIPGLAIMDNVEMLHLEPLVLTRLTSAHRFLTCLFDIKMNTKLTTALDIKMNTKFTTAFYIQGNNNWLNPLTLQHYKNSTFRGSNQNLLSQDHQLFTFAGMFFSL